MVGNRRFKDYLRTCKRCEESFRTITKGSKICFLCNRLSNIVLSKALYTIMYKHLEELKP